MMKKDKTWKQHERQHIRKKNGRYDIMHVCEDCGEKTGVDYWSDEDCNVTGKGLVLCKICCLKRENKKERTVKE